MFRVVVALLLVNLTPQSSWATNSCAVLFENISVTSTKSSESQRIFSLYKTEPGLKLIPQGEIPYLSKNMGGPRIENVLLDITGIFDLGPLATTLAVDGRSQKEIKQILQNYQTLGIFQIPLHELMPIAAKHLTNRFIGNDCNANCYNAVLLWHNLMSPVKGVSYMAFDQVLGTESVFERLLPGATLQYGDVIRAKYPVNNRSFHGAIYLNENLVWHKASTQDIDVWTFETFENAMGPYLLLLNAQIEFYRRIPSK